jgi:uncharacterized protein (UPF0335 family)
VAKKPGRGHNSGNDGRVEAFNTESAARLRSLVERVERLEEEKKALGSDIKDIYAEAKSAGFDVKVMRKLVMERRQEPATIAEVMTMMDLYRRALGMEPIDL